jgi:protein-tyrosine phosphatase
MPPANILFVCTGNIFRSPMAEAFLGARVLELGLDISVESAGTLDGDRVISPHVLEVIGTDGTDMAGHRSRRLDVEAVRRADLLLGMAREHVREAVLLDPSAWPRSFTFKEFVRRAETVGALRKGQALSDWLATVGAGRRREDLLGWSPDDDVADPIGGGPVEFRATGDELRDLVSRLVALVVPAR